LHSGPIHRNIGSLLFKEMLGGDLCWTTEYFMPHMRKYLPYKVHVVICCMLLQAGLSYRKDGLGMNRLLTSTSYIVQV